LKSIRKNKILLEILYNFFIFCYCIVSMVFRSAFNYLSQAGSNLLSGNEQHPLVGQTLEIGGRSLVVRSLLAEGGYALVFSVQDSRNGEWFALKRQLAADRIAADAVAQEIRILKKVATITRG
jgi:hypothetical protein